MATSGSFLPAPVRSVRVKLSRKNQAVDKGWQGAATARAAWVVGHKKALAGRQILARMEFCLKLTELPASRAMPSHPI